MAQRGMVRSFSRRLGWQQPDATIDEADRGWVARILTILFGFGGVLLLATLLFEGPPGRQPDELAGVALAAFGVAVFIFAGFDHLPLWFLRGAPAIGTLLVTLSIYYGGAEAAASYAMYMIWVVIAAAMFLDTRLILAHGALAIAAYAVVLTLL